MDCDTDPSRTNERPAAMPDAAFWRGRRVFVTGHTGFKGAWLCAWLQRMGAEIGGFALAPETSPSLCHLMDIEDDIEAVRGDIRDATALSQALRRFAPDIVLHLAAQALVRRSYREPVASFEINAIGTANLLEAVRAAPTAGAVVIVTSDKCFANSGTPAPFREDDRLGGHDPYSASKACAELVAACWRQSYGMPLATARAGNVIGGGDWSADRLVPDCVAAFGQGRRVSLRNPDATRPWQHVLDPLAGYLLLAEMLWRAPERCEPAWNFGPDAEDVRPVSALVAALAGAWGTTAGWTRAEGVHPHEAATLRIDAGMARRRLGWRPRLGVDQAIDWTAAWYREHGQGAPARRLVEQQIAAYENLGRLAPAEGVLIDG